MIHMVLHTKRQHFIVIAVRTSNLTTNHQFHSAYYGVMQSVSDILTCCVPVELCCSLQRVCVGYWRRQSS
jgi:hypothetical protein